MVTEPAWAAYTPLLNQYGLTTDPNDPAFQTSLGRAVAMQDWGAADPTQVTDKVARDAYYAFKAGDVGDNPYTLDLSDAQKGVLNSALAEWWKGGNQTVDMFALPTAGGGVRYHSMLASTDPGSPLAIYMGADPNLAIQGMTREGQQVRLDLGSTALDYYADPSRQGDLRAQALDRALQQGVDIMGIGDGKYVTGKFNDWADFLSRAPQLSRQFLQYAANPKQYALLEASAADPLRPLLGDLQQVDDLSSLGYSVYNAPALQDAIGQYRFIDPSKLGTDAFSEAMRQRGVDVNGQLALRGSDLDYYGALARAVEDSPMPYYGLNALADPFNSGDVSYEGSWWTGDPSQYVPVHNLRIGDKQYNYIPFEALSELGATGSNEAGFYGITGADPLFQSGRAVSLDSSLIPTDTANVDFNYANSGLGYLYDTADWERIAEAKPWSAYTFAPGAGTSVFAGQGLIRATPELKSQLINQYSGYQDRGGLAARSASIGDAEWFVPDPSNPNRVFTLDKDNNVGEAWTTNTWIEQQRRGGGGWLGDLLGGITQAIAPVLPVLNLIPGVNTITLPFTAGMRLGHGVQTGDLGSIASGALGVAGAMGFNPFESLAGSVTDTLANSSALSGIDPNILSAVVGGSLRGGIPAALTGGDILRAAIAGGVGGGVGEYVNSLDIGGVNSIIDKLAPSVVSAISRDLLLTGGNNVENILLNAGISGFAGVATPIVRGALDDVVSQVGDVGDDLQIDDTTRDIGDFGREDGWDTAGIDGGDVAALTPDQVGGVQDVADVDPSEYYDPDTYTLDDGEVIDPSEYYDPVPAWDTETEAEWQRALDEAVLGNESNAVSDEDMQAQLEAWAEEPDTLDKWLGKATDKLAQYLVKKGVAEPVARQVAESRAEDSQAAVGAAKRQSQAAGERAQAARDAAAERARQAEEARKARRMKAMAHRRNVGKSARALLEDIQQQRDSDIEQARIRANMAARRSPQHEGGDVALAEALAQLEASDVGYAEA